MAIRAIGGRLESVLQLILLAAVPAGIPHSDYTPSLQARVCAVVGAMLERGGAWVMWLTAR